MHDQTIVRSPHERDYSAFDLGSVADVERTDFDPQ